MYPTLYQFSENAYPTLYKLWKLRKLISFLIPKSWKSIPFLIPKSWKSIPFPMAGPRTQNMFSTSPGPVTLVRVCLSYSPTPNNKHKLSHITRLGFFVRIKESRRINIVIQRKCFSFCKNTTQINFLQLPQLNLHWQLATFLVRGSLSFTTQNEVNPKW